MTDRSGLLIVTRGLPASGKTTWAKQTGFLRANRDDLRQMLFNEQGVLAWDKEKLVSETQRAMVRAALKQDRTIIVDDTNLRLKYVKAWEGLAHLEGVEFLVKDFFDVGLNACVGRDDQRRERGERFVGPTVIGTLYDKFLAQHDGVLPPYEYGSGVPVEDLGRQYFGTPRRPDAVIVDIDGTIAHRREVDGSMRGPFDWTRVGQDSYDVAVTGLVDSLFNEGWKIIFVSGRDEVCRQETQDWINRYLDAQGPLFMRPAGSFEKDTLVKARIFWENIADDYNVLFALDDRNSVVEMWRAMGLKCLQTQLGDF